MATEDLFPEGIYLNILSDIKNVAGAIEKLKKTASASVLDELEKHLKKLSEGAGMSETALALLRKEMKNAADAGTMLSNVMLSVADATKVGTKSHKELTSAVKLNLLGWRKLSGDMSTGKVKIDKLLNTFGSMEGALNATKKAMEANRDKSSALTAAQKAQQKAVLDGIKAIQARIALMAENNKKMAESAVLQAKMTREAETNSQAYKRLQGTAKAAGNDFNKLTGFFGAQSLSLKGAYDSVHKYNQTLFDLKRTYNVVGMGTKDLSSAFKQVSKDTTFSQQQFAEFANTMANGYTAIHPTVTEIANFAEVLQSKFGPNVETSIAMAKELLGVFESFPPAQKAMMDAMQMQKELQEIKATKGEKSEDYATALEALKERGRLLTLNAGLEGASMEQLNNIAKATSAVSDEEKNLLSLNEKAAKVQQNSADAILAMGQAMEPTMELIAGSLQTITGMAKNLPNALLLGVAGFQAMGAVMGSGIVGNMKIIPGQVEVWLNGLEKVKGKMEEITEETERAAGAVGGAGRKSGGLADAGKRAATSVGGTERTPGGLSTAKYNDKTGGKLVRKNDGTLDKRFKVNKEMLAEEKKHAKEIVAISTKGTLKNEKIKSSGAERQATSVEAGGRQAEEAMGRGGKDVEESLKKSGKGGGLGKYARTSVAIGIGAATAGVMAYGSTKASSKAEGFSDEESHSRGLKSGGATAAGTVIGGAIGTSLGGPVGTMIGMHIGGVIGGAAGDAWNNSSKKDKKEEGKADLSAGISSGGIIEQNKEATMLMAKWQEIQATYAQNGKMLQMQADAIGTQTDMLNELFVLSGAQAEASYSKAFGVASTKLMETQGHLEDIVAIGSQTLGLTDVSGIEDFQAKAQKMVQDLSKDKAAIRVEIEIAKGEGDLEKQKKLENELIEIEMNRNKANKTLEKSYAAQTDSIKSMGDMAKALGNEIQGNLKPQLAMNKLIESRLDTERSLMESANFGMGASVQMMQKQVDLSYDNIKANQERLKVLDEIVAKEASSEKLAGAENKELLKQIMSTAKKEDSQAGVNAVIEKGLNQMGLEGQKREAVQAQLNEGVNQYNKLQNDSLSAQKKIYDLTKDVREGYLDAVREMSFGAGEFSKIIGTQDMGVTQLMESVKGVTGEDKLNSMALGGITSTTSAGGKARMGEAASYTTGGLKFGQISGKAQEAMNTDIYGYADSIKKVAAEGKGTAAAPTAGMDGGVSEHTNTVRAGQDKTTSEVEKLNLNMPKYIREGLNSSNSTPGLRSVRTPVRTGEGGSGAKDPEGDTRLERTGGIGGMGRGATYGRGESGRATGQAAARTNLNAPSLVDHGTLPATPSMGGNFLVPAADRTLKELNKAEAEAKKNYEALRDGNEDQAKINKARKNYARAYIKAQNHWVKRIEDANTNVKSGDIAKATASSAMGKIKADDAKAQEKIQDKASRKLIDGIRDSLSKASTATGSASSKRFEKDAGDKMNKLALMDSKKSDSLAKNMAQTTAEAMAAREDGGTKGDIASLVNATGKSSPKALEELAAALGGMEGGAEKLKALEKTLSVSSGGGGATGFFDLAKKGYQSAGGSLWGGIANSSVGQFMGMGKGPEEDVYKEGKLNEYQKSLRLGAAKSQAAGKSKMSDKVMTMMQTLSGKDIGSISGSEAAEHSGTIADLLRGDEKFRTLAQSQDKGKIEDQIGRMLQKTKIGESKFDGATQSTFTKKLTQDIIKGEKKRAGEDKKGSMEWLRGEEGKKAFSGLDDAGKGIAGEMLTKNFRRGMSRKEFRAKSAEDLKSQGLDPSLFKKEADAASMYLGEASPEEIAASAPAAAPAAAPTAAKGKPSMSDRKKAWWKKRNANMQNFIGSVSKDIERQDGESHSEAFKRTSFNQSATGGNQDWMESSEEIRKRMQKTEIAAKAYQKQQDAAAAGGAVEGGQGLKQSKEASKTASAAAQSEFTSQKTQEQRALSGFGESATSGGAGSATIIVKLAGPVEAQLADVAGLSVSLQNA
jgi:hypothetical protein